MTLDQGNEHIGGRLRSVRLSTGPHFSNVGPSERGSPLKSGNFKSVDFESAIGRLKTCSVHVDRTNLNTLDKVTKIAASGGAFAVPVNANQYLCLPRLIFVGNSAKRTESMSGSEVVSGAQISDYRRSSACC